MQVIERVDTSITIIATEFHQNKAKMATSHLVKSTWILFMQSLMLWPKYSYEHANLLSITKPNFH